jgi:hypothetical protein
MTSRSDRQPPGAPTDQDCCSGRSLFGWSRARLPAETPAKRQLDRILPTTGLPAILFFGAVIALLISAGRLAPRPSLIVDGVAAAAGGLWCLGNFWRSRHAHCLVTGIGWSALGLFAFVEASIGRSLISGDEQRVLLAVLVAGLAFEAWWTMRHATNAVMRGRQAP